MQCQYAECILQLALYPAGAEALRADTSMREVLSALQYKAWTEEAKRSAESTLMTLWPEQTKFEAEALHVMVSYQWSAQAVVKRIVAVSYTHASCRRCLPRAASLTDCLR